MELANNSANLARPLELSKGGRTPTTVDNGVENLLKIGVLAF